MASIFCVATATATSAPLLIPVAGLGVALYSSAVALDTFLTGRLCLFPLTRITVGQMFLLAAGRGRSANQLSWDEEYQSRQGLDESVPVFRLEPPTIDVPVVRPVPAHQHPQQMAPELDPFEFTDRPPMQPPIAQAIATVERRATERQVSKATSTPELDSASDLGQNPQSAIIAGVPGAGKGIFVSNALREMKVRNPHVRIFAIDPKNDPKETGYWSVADQLWRKDCERCDTETAATWLMARIDEYRDYRGPKLLVLDEGTMVLTILKLAKVFGERAIGDKIVPYKLDLLGEFKKFLVAISGMGDSRESWIWLVCQVINCEDLGITGGVRSIFRSIGLVSPQNKNAVTTFFATGFVPLPPGGKEALYRMMEQSPCNRAFYDGKTDKWAPTPLWENHSGYNRDTRTTLADLTTDLWSSTHNPEDDIWESADASPTPARSPIALPRVSING